LLSFGLVFVLVSDGNGVKPGFTRTLIGQVIEHVLSGEAGASGPSFSEENSVAASAVGGTINHAIFKSEEEEGGIIRRTLVIGRGQTLTARLVAAGISRTELFASLEALRPHVNPHDVRDGQNVVVLFRRDGNNESFIGVEVPVAKTGQLATVTRAQEGHIFKAELKAYEPQKKRFAIRGTVDDSLYESGLKIGIPAKILSTIIRTYSYTTDFQRDVHSGDHFEVLFEQNVGADGESVGDTVLIYAALEVRGEIKPVYRVAMPGGAFEYFDASGQSIRKGLLKTPVEGARLTSGFGMRRHPILGFSRMHKGVDFGAPTGTPIYAAGSGIVEEAGRKSGYGLVVKLRHNTRVSTVYAHMSHFGRGITRGTRISQGDIIGYVGSSGMATGPHLHYEVLVENQQVNPLTVDIPTNSSLSGTQLAAFQEWRNRVHSQFERLIADAMVKTKVAQAVIKQGEGCSAATAC
jgi:murein DD-endopeptidase MepM/ murein hydrolase activator NlpD